MKSPAPFHLIIAPHGFDACVNLLRWLESHAAGSRVDDSSGPLPIAILAEEETAALFKSSARVNQVFRYPGRLLPKHAISILEFTFSLRDQAFAKVTNCLPIRSKLFNKILGLITRTTVDHLEHSLGKAQSLGALSLKAPTMDPFYVRRKFGVSALTPMMIFIMGSDMPNSGSGQTLYQSNRDHRSWSKRYWLELAHLVEERYGRFQFALLGGIADRSRATELCALLGPNAHNLAGQTHLHETLALMACAHSIVGIDHPWTQLGPALQTPTVAIHGGTAPREGVINKQWSQVLWLQPPCSPCEGPICTEVETICLNQVAPRDVLNAVEAAHAQSHRTRLIHSES